MNDFSTSAASEDSMEEQRERSLRRRRRRRRVAAGRSGGTFELVRHGNQLTYQYVSPDLRRHQPGGQFSWNHMPLTGGFDDSNAKSTHNQRDHDPTAEDSRLGRVRENKHEPPKDAVGALYTQPTVQHQTPSPTRYQTYLESVYSELPPQTTPHIEVGPFSLNYDISNETLGETVARAGSGPRLGQAVKVQNVRKTETDALDEPLLSGKKLESPIKKMAFASMKDIKGIVKKVVGGRTGTRTAGKMKYLLEKAFHGKRLAVEREQLESVDDSHNTNSPSQAYTHNPSTPRRIERNSEMEPGNPVKEQLFREQEDDWTQGDLDEAFFTQPVGHSKSAERPGSSLDPEVFD